MIPRLLALVTESIEVGKANRDIEDAFMISVGLGCRSPKRRIEKWARANMFMN